MVNIQLLQRSSSLPPRDQKLKSSSWLLILRQLPVLESTARSTGSGDMYLSKPGTRSPRKVPDVAAEGGRRQISGASSFGWNGFYFIEVVAQLFMNILNLEIFLVSVRIYRSKIWDYTSKLDTPPNQCNEFSVADKEGEELVKINITSSVYRFILCCLCPSLWWRL